MTFYGEAVYSYKTYGLVGFISPTIEFLGEKGTYDLLDKLETLEFFQAKEATACSDIPRDTSKNYVGKERGRNFGESPMDVLCLRFGMSSEISRPISKSGKSVPNAGAVVESIESKRCRLIFTHALHLLASVKMRQADQKA